MSGHDTLPAIPGYAGPFTLKAFLRQYFQRHLLFFHQGARPVETTTSHDGHLYLEATGGFAILVYVSQTAPLAPPSALLQPCMRRGHKPQVPWRLTSHTLPAHTVTARVLSHGVWDNLAEQMGPSAMAFVLTYCPMLVQFTLQGGALQVLGPCLASGQAAPPLRGRYVVAPPQPVVRKRAREEPHTAVPPSTSAVLGRTDVTRRAVLGEVRGAARLCAERDDIPEHWLHVCWLRRHPTSRQALMAAVLPPARRRLQRKRNRSGDLAPAPPAREEVVVPASIVAAVFPYSLPAEPSTSQQYPYLHRVLVCLMTDSSTVDTRGAALRHTKYTEDYFEKVYRPQQRGASSSQQGPASRLYPLMAPMDVVVSYLIDLLGQIRWRAHADPRDAAGPEGGYALEEETASFWGQDGAQASTNLEALRATLTLWLSVGKRESFPLSSFAQGVRVSSIPWLNGLYTAHRRTEHQQQQRPQQVHQRHRSMLQQRIFMQVAFFISQHVIPFWLRRSFHITWSAKNPGKLVFIPLAVWLRLVRSERRRLQGPLSAVGLRPVETGKDVASSAPPSTQQQTMLYATIRFMPEAKKLRPIAVIRTANAYSLSKMARGVMSRHAAPYRIAQWLQGTSVDAVERGAVVDAPPPVTSLPGGRDVRSSASSMLRNALLCLINGLEDRRRRTGDVHPPHNRTHADEYVELRGFAEACRSSHHSAAGPLTLVRGDAVRCYDRLPQDAVMSTMHSLITHDRYQVLEFTVLRGTGSRLHRHAWRAVRPRNHTLSGVLSGIPSGWIVLERAAWAPQMGVGLRRRRAGDFGDAELDGDEVRRLLTQHLHKHLVVVGGRLYWQQTGLAQGSAVSMLLCDTLLHTVDAALSAVLVEHHEPSLLLRRVDDVLVLTASVVAGQRCLQALRRGWESIGYLTHPSKSSLQAGGGLVPWCGLLLSAEGLEVSVEWGRLAPFLSSLRVMRVTKAAELSSCMHRLLSVLWLRTPPTALCARLNSKRRAVQTMYEMALLWARLLIFQMCRAVQDHHAKPHISMLLVPLRLCVQHLRRLACRHSAFLKRNNSWCEVSCRDVRVCVLVALHRTVQSHLRQLRNKSTTTSALFWSQVAGCVQHMLEGCLRENRQRRRGHKYADAMLADDHEDSVSSAAWHAVKAAERYR